MSGAPTDNNIMIWNAVIFGFVAIIFISQYAQKNFNCSPYDTPFEDGTFKLTIEFNEEYPNKPPVVRFVSKMFHPNVYADGGICLDILQNRWSPTYDVSAILTSIQVNKVMPFPWKCILMACRCSLYWVIQTLIHRQTRWLHNCTRRIGESTRREWKHAWNKVS